MKKKLVIAAGEADHCPDDAYLTTTEGSIGLRYVIN
jgi:hypothetical protein